MKKILALALALLMLASMAACGTAGDSGNAGNESSVNGSDENKQSGETQGTENGQQSGNGTAESALSGKLIAIPNDRDDMPVLRGISFSGNRAGSSEFNSKPSSTEGIRCIFELNEYFMCTPDTDTTYGIRVYILKHREDQKSYEKAQYSDLMPGFVNLYYLDFNSDENVWDAEMYLNPADVEPGLYDFVFTYEKTPFAMMTTRFYAEGELVSKSDAELESLMKG